MKPDEKRRSSTGPDVKATDTDVKSINTDEKATKTDEKRRSTKKLDVTSTRTDGLYNTDKGRKDRRKVDRNRRKVGKNRHGLVDPRRIKSTHVDSSRSYWVLVASPSQGRLTVASQSVLRGQDGEYSDS